MRVECTACGEDIGRMGIGQHWAMHRREFEEEHGREPEDNDEVRAWLGGSPRGEPGGEGVESAPVEDGQVRLTEYEWPGPEP